jgi:transposase
MEVVAAIQEVIPMRSRTYGSVAVNQVKAAKVTEGRDSERLVVGMDIGKYQLFAVARWPDGVYERPWRVVNPLEIPLLIGLLKQLGMGRELVVALEPSGTYGDALRQALGDSGIRAERISPKAAHDYAEIFDGVPSQHDGKDAAVVAELAATGKGKDWAYEPAAPWEQELTYWVERLEWYSRIHTVGLGYIEALLGRHWPEATRVLAVSSGTVLRILETYGGPAELAADKAAPARLARWGGTRLSADKVQQLLASACATTGVRQGEWDRRRLREHAERTRLARREVARCKRLLRILANDHEVLQAHGKVVGMATACVLWASVGDPRAYSCARAYRKAMGLNLTERSSGIYQGKLKISKRGNPRARQWLYLAALRLVKHAGVQPWYQAKKARDGDEARRALVAVMRKLALALFHVGARGARFDAKRLFAGVIARKKREPAAGRKEG